MQKEEEEITNNINAMIDSKNIENMKLAASIIKNQPDMVVKKDLHWYDINNYITKDTIKHAELYCSDGKADKVYIIVMTAISKKRDEYAVDAYYGRRGKTMQHDNKCKGVWSYRADSEYDSLLSSKLKKGYQIINTNES